MKINTNVQHHKYVTGTKRSEIYRNRSSKSYSQCREVGSDPSRPVGTSASAGMTDFYISIIGGLVHEYTCTSVSKP